MVVVRIVFSIEYYGIPFRIVALGLVLGRSSLEGMRTPSEDALPGRQTVACRDPGSFRDQ